jgi:hypothetical protein
MESRTRAIRLEDLHFDADETMRDFSSWLGLPYQDILLESTFNGIPYVIKRDGIAWHGRRAEQVQRQPRYLSLKDRALQYATLYENFADWNYPCPKILGNPIVRSIVFVSLFLLPMKMEIVAARAVFKNKILPAVRQGSISVPIKSVLRFGVCRLRIIWLWVTAFIRRCAYRTTLLRVEWRPLERRDIRTEAQQETNELR